MANTIKSYEGFAQKYMRPRIEQKLHGLARLLSGAWTLPS